MNKKRRNHAAFDSTIGQSSPAGSALQGAVGIVLLGGAAYSTDAEREKAWNEIETQTRKLSQPQIDAIKQAVPQWSEWIDPKSEFSKSDLDDLLRHLKPDS